MFSLGNVVTSILNARNHIVTLNSSTKFCSSTHVGQASYKMRKLPHPNTHGPIQLPVWVCVAVQSRSNSEGVRWEANSTRKLSPFITHFNFHTTLRLFGKLIHKKKFFVQLCPSPLLRPHFCCVAINGESLRSSPEKNYIQLKAKLFKRILDTHWYSENFKAVSWYFIV